MYQIKCDDYHLYDYRLPELIVTDPKLKIAVNTVGEASFVIHNEHPYFSKLKVLKSIFEISDEIGVIFRGRMTNNSYDFHNSKAVDLEGLMAFFNDSVVRPFKFPEDFTKDAEYISASQSGNVVRFFLKWLIDNHNSQVEDFQKFKLGNVTVSDPNNYITRSESKYSSTWEVLKNKLFDSALGGHLCIRYESDGNYIDYLSAFELTNTQEIQYGENLIDLKNEIDAANTYSAIIPLGAEVETEKADENGEKIKKTLDLSEIADGTVAPDVMKKGDTIYSISAVQDYGWIYAPVEDTTWSDVTIASRLLNKAIEYLTGDAVKVQNNIEISAVDLHFTDAEIRSFRLYRNVKVNSLPHGQEAVLPLTSLNIDLLKPQNTKIVLGRTQRTLSEITNDRFQSAIDKIQSSTDELKGKYSSTQNSLNDLTSKIEGAIEGTYLYIAYSAYEDGREMTDKPAADTVYMGTCSTSSTIRPTDHKLYTWVKVKGIAGDSLQVKYLNSATTPTITDNNVSGWQDTVPTPEAGKKVYMIQKLASETNWSTPIQITGEDGTTPEIEIDENGYWLIDGETTGLKAQGEKGEKPTITVGANGNWYVDGKDTGTKAQGEQGKDGADIEYVYYRSQNAVSNLAKPKYENGTLSSGWKDSPQGITETYKYEYVSVRKKTAGSSSWGEFSTPIIWSKWGEKGTDGDGIEYKYYLSDSADKPAYSAGSSNWTDDPTGVSEDYMYEYVVQITHHGDGTSSTSDVALWAKWGQAGSPGASAVAYSMITSSSVIAQSATGTLSPSSITLSCKSQTGSNQPVDCTCRLYIEITTDMSTWTAVYNNDTKSYTYSIPSGTKALRCSMYMSGGRTSLLDQQIIPVVSDGSNGNDAYTVILSNESHTFAGTTSSATSSNPNINVYVVAYKGATQIATKITKIGTTTVSGTQTVIPYTGLSFTTYNNGGSSTSNYVQISAANTLITKSGTVTLTIQADGKTFTKDFSFSLALSGADGKTQYWHIKYSNDGGTTLTGSDGEELGSWIGTYVDFNEADSTDPTKYTWKKFTEDVDEELEDIRQIIENYSTDIVRNTQEITLLAAKEYIETSALNSYKEEVDSKFTQTADSIDMQFTKATTQINNVNGDLQSKFEKISKYITFNENGITIGGGANAMTLSLDNDTGIIFSKNGTPFGWWDGVDFHTGNLVVTVNERAQFGDFAFIPRSSGSLSFLKVKGSASSSHTHSYSTVTTQSPTCTEAGVMAYICACGESHTETIPATGHTDSTGDGKCDVCGVSTGSGKATVKISTSGASTGDTVYINNSGTTTINPTINTIYTLYANSTSRTIEKVEMYTDGVYTAEMIALVGGLSTDKKTYQYKTAVSESFIGKTIEYKVYFTGSSVLVSGDIITEGAEVSVDLPVQKERVDLYFTPKYSGSYTIKSLDKDTLDPDCYVYDSAGSVELAKATSSGAFNCTYASFVAGTTYKLQVFFYSGTGTLKMQITYNG